jgi:CBS domain-containing protein
MDVSGILRLKGSEVATIRATQTVAEAVALLAERNLGALVVSPDGVLVEGIVSERDVVRQLGTHGPESLDAFVSSIATMPATTCHPSDGADEVMATMTNGRFRHLPVIEEGRMVGIVSIGDVVKNRVTELETTNHQLESYITGVPN